MKDLTHDPATGARAVLVPSSMQGGNTVSDDPGLSMTAPGSASVLPEIDKLDHLPLPEIPGSQMPVSHPGQRDKVKTSGGSNGGGTFETITVSGSWKEL
jgi:hypothetical protein